MSAADWFDLLDGFTYIFAQTIYYTLAMFLALMILASIMRFVMDSISFRNKDG